MRVLVTGSRGVIGSVLVAGLGFDIVPFDLPAGDARDEEQVRAALAGCDAAVHLAWKIRSDNQHGGFDPDNLAMAFAAVRAALAARVERLVLASSVHAHNPPLGPGEINDPTAWPVPDSAYGASKVWMEAYGRHVAMTSALEVVAIRFGGVNAADEQPRGDPYEHAVWLPHRDCVSVVHEALTMSLPPDRYALLVGVGDNEGRTYAFSPDSAWRPAPREGGVRQSS